MIDGQTPPSAPSPSQPVQPPAHQQRRIGRIHIILSLALLLLFLCTCAAIELGAHSEGLADWLQERETARAVKKDSLVPYTRGFVDAGDRLLLGDLPKLDTSKGGVYIFGASVALYCLEDWRLPPDQARLIHNFGFYSVNPTQMLQLIRFVTKNDSLLSAGGERTLVFLGLALTDMMEANPDNDIGGTKYLPACVERSGLYDYDPQDGISPIRMSPLMWRLTYEKARGRSFLLRCLLGADGARERQRIDPAQFKKDLVIHLGPNWPEVMDRQMSKMGEILDFLQARHVNVVPFFVPRGSWTSSLPACERFVSVAQALCDARQIPLIDYGHLLKDEEFSDPSHPAAEGTRKVQALLMKIALDFLHHTGALSDREDDSFYAR